MYMALRAPVIRKRSGKTSFRVREISGNVIFGQENLNKLTVREKSGNFVFDQFVWNAAHI